MRNARRLVFAASLVAVLAACSQIAPQAPSASGGTLRSLALAGTATLQPSPMAAQYGVQPYEFGPAQFGFGVDTQALQRLQAPSAAGSATADRVINRIPNKQPGTFRPSGPTAPRTLGTAALASATQSFEGLNLFDQRFANNGTQFTVEPPDQGLCAGNGHVLEAVNDVVRVFDQTDGTAVLPVADLNTFLGYAPAIVRAGPGGNPVFGPSVTDPSCVYDAGSQRWFLVTLTLATVPASGALTGQNWLDVAVSGTSDPTGSWHVYHLNVTTDGRNCPCLGDYPHIGIDAGGLYITTNNFPLSGNHSPSNATGFNGAWVYALDKAGLVAGRTHVNVVAMAATDPTGVTSYTLAPALPAGSAYPATQHGTEYFLSSTTADIETSSDIVVWALDGTNTLSARRPQVNLSSAHVAVTAYGDPTAYVVPQQAGDVPLADALTDDLFGYGDAGPQSEGPIATNDSRMLQTMFVNGTLYGALTTAVSNDAGFDDAPTQENPEGSGAGVEWFAVTPSMGPNGVEVAESSDGVVAPTGVNLLFPAMTVNADGQGVIAVTAVGPSDYPSAGYLPFDASTPDVSGTLVITHAGDGPQDGFSEYWLGGGRPRWGDYGAGAVDPSTGHLWIASEAIHQTCSYTDYATGFPAGTTCGGTRAPLGNWSTQISEITP